MKRINNSKINTIIIFILTIIILFLLLRKDFFDVLSYIINSNYLFLLCAILTYFISFICEQITLYFLTINIDKRIKFKSILKIGAITKFFNGITPLSSGGQPYQVYELHKRGVAISKGTSIVIQNYILFQISLILLAIISLITNKIFNLFTFYPILKHMTIIGFSVNFIILIFLLIVGFSKKFNRGVVLSIVKVLNKIRLVKDVEYVNKKWTKICNEYHEGSQSLLKSKKTFILGFIFQFISLACNYFIVYSLAKSLDITGINALGAITTSTYVFLTSCYVPLPGASGGVEFAFLSFFGNFISGAKLKSLLLTWRLITFYMPCILGAILLNFGGKSKNTLDKEN